MKKSLLSGVVALLLVAGVGFWFFTSSSDTRDYEKGQEAETEELQERMKQEFMRIRDPKLNIVPTDRLYQAIDFLEQEQKVKMRTTGIDNYNTLGWTERGPSNVGGRTRALFFDASDITNKRVFAAGVGGGIWRCNDITAAVPLWTAVNDQLASLAVTAMIQDPGNSSIIYAGTGEGFFNSDAIRGGGIWKSIDGGATFTRLTATANNPDFYYIQDMAVTSGGTLYVTTRGDYCNTNGGVQRSKNGGTSFSRVLGANDNTCEGSNMNAADLEIGPGGDLFATVGLMAKGKIFRSPASLGPTQGDMGNWTEITPAPVVAGSFTRTEVAVAPSNSSRLYALFTNPSTNNCTAIYTTTDALAATPNWTACTIPTIIDQGNNSNFARGQGFYDLICLVDPSNEQTLYIGGIDILKSTNAGTNWTQISIWSRSTAESNAGYTGNQVVHADQHIFAFRPGTSGTTMLVGNDGGLSYTTDVNNAGAFPTWASKSSNYNITQYYATSTHPTNTNYFLAGAQDNGSQKFTTAGINATTQVTGGDGAFNFIRSTNPDHQLTSYVNNNYWRSTDGGVSFPGGFITGAENTGRFINPADLDETNGILYSASNADQIRRWLNVFGTVSASNLTIGLNSRKASALEVSPNNATTIYVGTDQGNIYRVTNANATPSVTQVATNLGSTGAYVSNIEVWRKKVAPLNDDSIVVSLSNYGINSVFHTANGSAATPTWTDIDDNSTLPDIPVRWATFSPLRPDIIFLGTEVGVFGLRTFSGGTSVWQQINNGALPQVRTDMLKFNSANQLVAATHGRGLWTSSTIQPLPISLLAFEAALEGSGKTVRLSWNIKTPEEVREYGIERLAGNSARYEAIGTLQATDVSNYNFIDPHPDWAAGPQRYRLRISANSGLATYSETRTVLPPGSGYQQQAFLAKAYPTSTTGRVQIETGNAAGVSSMKIAVFGLNGIPVLQTQVAYANYELNLEPFPAGLYLVVVTDGAGKTREVFKIYRQ